MAKQSPTAKIVTKKHIARLERERQQVALIKWIALGSIVIVALLLGYGYLKTTYFLMREPVAEVNGDVITMGQWQERVRLERLRELNLYQTYVFYQQSFGMDTSQQQQQLLTTLGTPSILGQQVLDIMIDEVLVRQEAAKLGITVSEEELNGSIQEVYEFFPNGTLTPTLKGNYNEQLVFTNRGFGISSMGAEFFNLFWHPCRNAGLYRGGCDANQRCGG